MTPSGMSPEEYAQAASGPNGFAHGWVSAAAAGRIELVWPAMTAAFRLAMAQGWITDNPGVLNEPSTAGLDRDQVAQTFAAADCQHALFVHLARYVLRDLRRTWDNIDPSELLIGSRPRVVSPTLEVVRLFLREDMSQDDAGNYYSPDGPARSAAILVERVDSAWQIAGAGGGIVHPGWPPRFELIVTPED